MKALQEDHSPTVTSVLIIPAVAILVGMAVFESVKQLILQDITVWQSRLVTIVFGTLMGTGACYFVTTRCRISCRKITPGILDGNQTPETIQKGDPHFQALAETMNEGVGVFDESGLITFANEKLCDLLGYEREELLARPFSSCMSGISRSILEAKIASGRRVGYGSCQIDLRTKDGQMIPAFISLSPVLDRDGDVGGAIAVVSDITVLRCAERAFRQSEAKYRLIFDNSPLGIFHFDPNGIITACNDSLIRMSGSSRERLVGFNLLESLKDGSMKAAVSDCISGKSGYYEGTYRWVTGDKETHVKAVLGPILEEGVFMGGVGVVEDVSEAKRAEDELRGSEERLKILFEFAPDAYYLVDLDGNFVDGNRAAEEVSGYTKGELIGKNLFRLALLPEKEKPRAAKNLAQSVLGQSTGPDEFTLVRRNGDQVFLEIRTIPTQIKGQTLILCIARDITSRKAAEDALRKSEARYRAIVDDQTELVSRFLPDGTLTFVNEAYCRYFGETPEELIGHKFWHHLPEADQGKFREHLSRLSPQKVVASIEHRVFTSTGETRWQQWTDRAILDDQGRIVEIQAVGRDITERKRAEEVAQFERQRLFSLLDELPAIIYLQAPDHSIPYANRCFRAHFGDPEGRLCFEILQGKKEPCGECPTFRVFETRLPQHYEWTRADSVTRQVYDYPFFDSDGSMLVLEMAIDITDRKRAEEALRESEKQLRFLSSRLLSAQEEERRRIARELHDSVGSSLAGVKIFLENALNQMEAGSGTADLLRPLVQMVQDTMQESRRIMMDLRPSVLDDFGIVMTIAWFCNQFQTIYPAVQLERQVELDEHEISEPLKIVIFRLLQEALHNIAKYSKAKRVSVSLGKEKDAIELVIEDDGVGFDLNAVLSRDDQTRGLGLTSMKERTELSGGCFVIESAPGRGTAVRASWPSRCFS